MKTIETKAIVTRDGKLIANVPPNIKAGEHSVVIAIHDASSPKQNRLPLAFPVDHYGSWPSDFSLHREDLYGDNGR